MVSEDFRKRFGDDPAGKLEKEIKDFTSTSTSNRMPSTGKYPIYDEPLVRFAAGNDPLFNEYKTLISSIYLTPAEALAKAYDVEKIPGRLTVISWILPITGETRKSNRAETKVPSRFWSHTRYYGEVFNDTLRQHIVEILQELGYKAAAPLLQPYFKMERNEKGLYSNWSERHVAYAAGHGTFSLSDGFITERGIAHRCGSVVTDLLLPASPRTAESPYDNCLYYFDGSCTACVERCPANAVTGEGHDKEKCREYIKIIGYDASEKYDDASSVWGCGFCQTKVPCEYGIPAKILKSRAG